MAHARSRLGSFVAGNWGWGIALLIVGLFGNLVYDNYVTEAEIRDYRAQNCPPTMLNPENLVPGSPVLINAVRGNLTGQVVTVPKYVHEIDGSGIGVSKYCKQREYFEVRIGSHGIAHDGGNWSTARPEVLPVKQMQHFEISSDPNG